MAGKLPAGTFVKYAVNSPVFRFLLQEIQDLAHCTRENRRVKMSPFCKVATLFGSRKIVKWRNKRQNKVSY